MVYLDSLVLMHGSNVKREQQESGMSQITPPPQIIYTQPERKFITYQNIPQRLSLKIRAVIRSIPGISPHFLLASEIWLTQNEASEINSFTRQILFYEGFLIYLTVQKTYADIMLNHFPKMYKTHSSSKTICNSYQWSINFDYEAKICTFDSVCIV